MSKVFLAHGSNKGNREEYLIGAIKSFLDDVKIDVLKCASVYETKPYGEIPQNNYLNSAVLIETEYTPDEIYNVIKRIEKEVGRTESVRWGEREIDIDIILIDSLIFENDKIIIPHKEYNKRDFVLVPIHEIDNELIDPKSKKPVFARVGRFGPMIKIRTKDDEEKPAFASIPSSMGVKSINLEQALALFNLPRIVGKTAEGEEILANNGRYGPYLQFDGTYVSLPKTEDPITITLEVARELVNAKKLVDAPIAEYEGLPVQKNVGRFGPYIKWNGIFINVNKRYDFDNLTKENIVTLIEEKKQKAAQRKKQKQTQVKEIKLRPGTEEGDYQVKLRNLIRFLEAGDKAKVTIRYRGREMAHQEIGMQLLNRIEADLEEYGAVEQRPKMEGRQMMMVIAPKKKK